MIIAFICGIVFALIAQYVRLNTFNKIISTALRRSNDVIQIMLFAIAVSSIAFFIEFLLGGAVVSVKPLYVAGISVGGLLFGSGIAILGYCPGTLTMAMAEGNIDALFGYCGGILAGAFFTIIYPSILPFMGPNFGEINLYSTNKVYSGLIVMAYATTLFAIAIKLGKSNKSSQPAK